MTEEDMDGDMVEFDKTITWAFWITFFIGVLCGGLICTIVTLK